MVSLFCRLAAELWQLRYDAVEDVIRAAWGMLP